MPYIGRIKVYYWSEKERALHNTDRHKLFVKELYPHASLPYEEFMVKLEEFKLKHKDL